jgi:hypothetical protein
MHGVQEPQLLDDQEQEDYNRTSRDEEILPALPEASAAQGDQVEGLGAFAVE